MNEIGIARVVNSSETNPTISYTKLSNLVEHFEEEREKMRKLPCVLGYTFEAKVHTFFLSESHDFTAVSGHF